MYSFYTWLIDYSKIGQFYPSSYRNWLHYLIIVYTKYIIAIEDFYVIPIPIYMIGYATC